MFVRPGKRAERENSATSFLVIHDFLVELFAGGDRCWGLTGPENDIGVVEELGSSSVFWSPPVFGVAGCCISAADF